MHFLHKAQDSLLEPRNSRQQLHTLSWEGRGDDILNSKIAKQKAHKNAKKNAKKKKSDIK